MPRRAMVVAVGLALMLFGVTAGWTQTDLAKLLVGRWTGDLRTETGTYDRTLVVKSIDDRSGQLVTTAEYGDRKLAPVLGVVEMINGEIVLRFTTPERRTAVLTLYRDGKNLIGPVAPARWACTAGGTTVFGSGRSTELLTAPGHERICEVEGRQCPSRAVVTF